MIRMMTPYEIAIVMAADKQSQPIHKTTTKKTGKVIELKRK